MQELSVNSKKLPTLFILILIILLGFSTIQCAHKNRSESSKKSGKRMLGDAGLTMPPYGVAVDGVYDGRLDRLIPGYKILNVVVSNRGQNPILMDPRKDRWIITDHLGQKYKAINHLKLHDPHLWSRLPRGLQEEIDYPQIVRPGNTTRVDLMVPASMDLLNFKQLEWKSSFYKKWFVINMAQEKALDIKEDKQTLYPNSKAVQQSSTKYDTVEPPVAPVKPDVDAEPTPTHHKGFDPLLDSVTIPMN